MKSLVTSVLAIVGLVIVSPVSAQVLPVTTTSKEGRAHFELGRLDAFHYQDVQALEHLDAAIELDSAFVLAYLHRGGMSESRQVARPYFEQAVAHREVVTPGEQRLIDAFLAFLQNGEPERAVEIFQELADDFPDDPYLPTYLGLRYLRNLGQYDKAIEQFERALSRDSGFVQAFNWMGYAALAKEDYAAAEEAFKRYKEGAPDEPRPYNSLGDLYLRRGQYEEAAHFFEQALKRYPGFRVSADKLVLVRIREAYGKFRKALGNGDFGEAAELYTQSGQILPPEGGAIEGPDAIRQYWSEASESGLESVERETTELFSGSDGAIRPDWLFSYERLFATEFGKYRQIIDGGETESGHYIAIWQKTPDGWKIDREMWTVDSASAE